MEKIARLLPLIFLFLGVSCAVTGPPPPQKAEIRPEIMLGNSILHAVQNGDFRGFTEALSGRIRVRITEADFRTTREKMLRQFGRIVTFRELCEQRTPEVGNHVWLVTMERENSRKEKITSDLLFRLVTGKEDQKQLVLGMGFF